MAGVTASFFSILFIFLTYTESSNSAALVNNSRPCQVDTTQVHFKEFVFQKFVGLWYTTWRSRSHVEGESVQSESKEFYVKQDKTLSLIQRKTLQNGDNFIMYEKSLSDLGNATYNIQDAGKTVIMVIIETDYNSSTLLMYCTQNFQDGVCAANDVYFEILSRNIKIIPELEMSHLSKIDELCSSFESMVYIAAECQDDSVVMESIPVLPIFNLQTKNGLSYSLAQSTFNSANSVTGFNIYLPYSNRIIGWFNIETRDGHCSPVMSSFIKQLGKSGANVYNRIGGLASNFPWIQLRVLYSDANYTLSHLCYSDNNVTCHRQMEEVRLDGRVNFIDPNFQRKLYVLLQKVCMSPENMQDIIYKADCHTVLLDSISSITEEFEKVKNNECSFENLVVAQYNSSFHKIDGLWYNVASINSEPGEMIYITTNPEKTLEIFNCESVDNQCEWNSQMRLVQMCDGIAQFIKHVADKNTTAAPIHLLRMAYIDQTTFFSYECHSENQGICEDGHLQFKIYSRVQNLTEMVLEKLENFLSFFCLQISELKKSINFPMAATDALNKTDFPFLSKCAAENIPQATGFNQSKILGYWYEIARSGLEENYFPNLDSSPHSAVVHFTQDEFGNLMFNYFAVLKDKCVSNIFAGKTQLYCQEQFDGNYIARLGGKSLAFFKILYFVEDDFLIMYACTFISPNGECTFPLLHVLGKKPKYTEELKVTIDQSLKKSCVETINWVIPEFKKNCTDFFLNEYSRDYEIIDENDDQQATIDQADKNETQINLTLGDPERNARRDRKGNTFQ